MKSLPDEDAEPVLNHFERERRDVAGKCYQQGRPHEYGDYTFRKKESIFVMFFGWFLRRLVRRYKCRYCHKTLKSSDLKELKQIRRAERMVKRLTR